MNRTINLEFITPLFSHGATDAPEVRAPSIRGELHWWFRMLGGTIEQERTVFGGIRQNSRDIPNADQTTASRVVVRVSSVKGNVGEEPTLPHKTGGASAPRKAYLPGATCRVTILTRRGALSAEVERLLNDAVNAWLLMGTLGYRATRAAGSFSWHDDQFPSMGDAQDYQDACRDLLEEHGAKAKVALLPTVYSAGEAAKARKVISDSLGGPVQRRDPESVKAEKFEQKDSLSRLHEPLGFVDRGKRKTSPLKYRLVKLGTGIQILAFWDGRKPVTGNDTDDLYGVVDLLKRKKPAIGIPLSKVFD